jgi:hypothetical protein
MVELNVAGVSNNPFEKVNTGEVGLAEGELFLSPTRAFTGQQLASEKGKMSMKSELSVLHLGCFILIRIEFFRNFTSSQSRQLSLLKCSFELERTSPTLKLPKNRMQQVVHTTLLLFLDQSDKAIS